MSFFGQNIRFLRNRAQLSQTAFAEIFSLKRAAVGAYEEERAEPKVEVFVKIARHFGIPVEDLICRSLQAGGCDGGNMAGILYFGPDALDSLWQDADYRLKASGRAVVPGLEAGGGEIAVSHGGCVLIVRELQDGDLGSMAPGRVLVAREGGLAVLQGTARGDFARAFEITHIIKPFRGQDYSELMLGDISRRLEALEALNLEPGSAAMGRGAGMSGN